MNFKNLLDSKTISVAKLAEKLGVSRNTVYRWINGATPTFGYLDGISEFLNINIIELVHIFAEEKRSRKRLMQLKI